MTQPDFGRDTSCTDSLRVGVMVSGPRLVGEACYRRLTTPRGQLRGGEDEANYGIDLPGMVGSVKSENDVAAIPSRVKNELMRDDRLEDVSISATLVKTGPAIEVTLEIEGQTGPGPFTLTLSVSDVKVELVGLSA